MQDTNPWRMNRPTEGLVVDEPAFQPGMPVRSLLPDRYEHGYAYPLIVLFHGRGSSEEQVLRIAPRVSRQNFVFLSLRGPERIGRRKNGNIAYGWEHEDADSMFGEYVRLSVQLARATYHIHSERIFLLGVREGAEAAFRAAFALGNRVAGVVALNGLMPRPADSKPLFQIGDVRHMKCFFGHGEFNERVSREQVLHDYRALYAAGADVHYRRYAADRQLHPQMMRDVNEWLINHVNAEHDLFVEREVEAE